MHSSHLKKVSDEVFISAKDIVRINQSDVEFIKQKAVSGARGRARICAHARSEDNLHEMIIALTSDSYIRPHRHHNKIESFHLIEGQADVVIFNDDGSIKEVVKIGVTDNFYYRLNSFSYHTLIIHSPIFVIHEVTNGPFDINASDYASFSPDDSDPAAVENYINKLKNRAFLHAN